MRVLPHQNQATRVSGPQPTGKLSKTSNIYAGVRLEQVMVFSLSSVDWWREQSFVAAGQWWPRDNNVKNQEQDAFMLLHPPDISF
jgi:hypothetical protein